FRNRRLGRQRRRLRCRDGRGAALRGLGLRGARLRRHVAHHAALRATHLRARVISGHEQSLAAAVADGRSAHEASRLPIDKNRAVAIVPSLPAGISVPRRPDVRTGPEIAPWQTQPRTLPCSRTPCAALSASATGISFTVPKTLSWGCRLKS